MSHQSADPLNAAVLEEIERLKALDFSHLVDLPSSTELQVAVDLHTVAVVVWHDVLPSGEHRIVAQANRRTWLGFGVYLSATGFAMSGDGALRALTDEELSAFS